MGDFNDIRYMSERMNSEFVALNAYHFNRFIDTTDLVEYNMGGRHFTYHSDNGIKLSKLDRFLVCRGFMNLWSTTLMVALSNVFSDHYPIFLPTVPKDFGPKPTRSFNSLLDIPWCLEYVDQLGAWFRFNGPTDLALGTKLECVKFQVKYWVASYKANQDGMYGSKLDRLDAFEVEAEARNLLPHDLEERAECRGFIMEAYKLKLMDMKQKSRVKWTTNADENTTYFHGITNVNTSCNRINGLHIGGAWVTFPPLIKDVVYSFFRAKFLEPMVNRPFFDCPNLSSLSNVEADSLVCSFSIIEVKNAVWECDGDRAPGPDGVNFYFIKKCWGSLQGDFIKLFEEFYWKGSFCSGCTSSFITLIPKRSDLGGLSD
ncbi:uncharacterized protein LOC110887706 [Helianthus annuus]|uniref:uncharacterized protein LOC110887706 n=1 Tax=Helianthus annuus TaxID=4232 RepID=UPI000B907C0C|nr:uncharacterized protein LOC110887706 [Helianthus annuus]